MSLRPPQIDAFLTRHEAVVQVFVRHTQGSVPREAGAFMLVSKGDMIGTIGGGQLEFIAVDAARAMLRSGEKETHLDVPLGPEIGQCCGGRVQVTLALVDAQRSERLMQHVSHIWRAAPHIYVFGAGHVGRALAFGLSRLPFAVTLLDTRANVFAGLPPEIATRQVALPEAAVRDAKSGSAFVVLTHDHALDFLIMGEVLKRGDAAYAGMIGSKSKRAQFLNWFNKEYGTRQQVECLICPIGAQALGDKRPEIIAALTIAEIIGKIDENDSAEPSKSANLVSDMGVVHGA